MQQQCQLKQLGVQPLAITDHAVQRDIDHCPLGNPNHDVIVAGQQVADRCRTQCGSQYPVMPAGPSTTLDMAQNADSGVLSLLLQLLGQAVGQTRCAALGNHDNATGTLACPTAFTQIASQFLNIHLIFRHDHHLGTGRNAHMSGQKAGVTAHHFNQEVALV